jgi:hypothetical protein
MALMLIAIACGKGMKNVIIVMQDKIKAGTTMLAIMYTGFLFIVSLNLSSL